MSTPVFRRDRRNMTHRSLEETLTRRASNVMRTSIRIASFRADHGIFGVCFCTQSGSSPWQPVLPKSAANVRHPKVRLLPFQKWQCRNR